jgi:hypothetical protein
VRLSHALHCTLEELGTRLSAEEFALHVAYWQLEPVGPQGQMHMWARLLAATHNGQLVRRDKRLFRAEDFWSAQEAWKPAPTAAAPGSKQALPDFSQFRGMKVIHSKKR